MKELSLHILDLMQNSIQADATHISLCIEEHSEINSYEITIRDNGVGMSEQTKKQIIDPFFTTKDKKTGLGIPLLKQHAEQTGGGIQIISELCKGASIKALFSRDHIDRQPLGDIAITLTGLIRAYPKIEFEYTHKVDNDAFKFSTIEIKQELEDISITSGEVIAFINELINENLAAITAT